MHPTIDRLGNRAKREVVARFPPATRWAVARRSREREEYRARLPSLDEGQRRHVQTLEERGIVVGAWSDLGMPGVDALKPLLSSLAEELAGRPARPEGSDSTVRLSRDAMLEDISLYQWGLRDAVLDLVENHLGVPIRYYGPLVHRELADARVISTRQWHRDIEDHRVLKVLVVLNDVDADGGPFTYVPRATSERVAKQLRYAGGYVDDERFASFVPASEWMQATGPQWTAALPDTAQIFHRAQAPVARDRYSVTFTWTSRTPIKVISAEPWTRDQARRAMRDLGGRQTEALPEELRAAAG